MKNFKSIIIISFTCFLVFSACHKKQDPATVPVTPTANTGTLYVHLHTDLDTNEVLIGDTAYTSDRRKITLTTAQLYLSGFKAFKSDGSSVSIQNSYILKTVDSELYLVGTIPVGNYTTIGFNVGLDSVANAKDPSTFPSGSIFAMHTPSMWFGSTQKGYMFANISGYIDTSANKKGNANYPFNYKIGSNALLQTVKMPAKAFTITPNGVGLVHIIVDYAKVINGLSLSTQNMTDTYTINPSLAPKVAANLPNLFRYE